MTLAGHFSSSPFRATPRDERIAVAEQSFPQLFRVPGTQDVSSCVPQTKPKTYKVAAGQRSLWSTEIDPDVLALAEATSEAHEATVIPIEQRAFIRRHTGIRRLYDDWILPDLLKRVTAGTLSIETVHKDRQAITRWERFTRPEDWPATKDWPGWPLEFINASRLEEFLKRLHGASDVAAGTAKSTWSHLRNILNHAVLIRAIDVCPKPKHIPNPQEGIVQIYRAEQLAAAYHALRHDVDLQVAFVLAINAGPRAADVFLLEWSKTDLTSDKPTLQFTARKTGKPQTIPLAPLTVAHLKRLKSFDTSPYLFPRLSSPLSKDPERSKIARARRDRINSRFLSAGLEEFDKPFQAARATCNTRLERHRTGSGCFVLGHSLTLNSRHYHEPSDLIFDAVNSIPQPECFHDF